jgi:hypothetical protein
MKIGLTNRSRKVKILKENNNLQKTTNLILVQVDLNNLEGIISCVKNYLYKIKISKHLGLKNQIKN